MYHLSVVTPEEVIFDGMVKSVIAPGGAGYLQVLTHHAPIISSLKDGPLTIQDVEGKKMTWQVEKGGLLEVKKNEAVILADRIKKEK